MLTVADVVRAIEALYPPQTADDWDRVGLIAGDPAAPVRRLHLAVDPTLAVVQESLAAGAGLLFTHHPLMLRGVSSVATTSSIGATVTAAIRGQLA
ncbi:MAG TPA: Nif3-like dinuclear metal center hexameric protein, partial [Dermatophilaceae bacterium]|nr:Nif3-like dinuclear metal center hexameric protein [Dermatophilaceae bacterium]